MPFIYGIEHAGNLRGELLLSPPSGCAAAFATGDADIALVPVGAIPFLPGHKIVTSFCIGAEKSVRTVVVVGNSPVEKVKDLYLDSHSMTSAVLAQVLAAEKWHISPTIHDLDDYSMLDRAADTDAFLLIGDKVFANEGRFSHSYDLADQWREMTGLPFVFAVWVAREGVHDDDVEALEQALGLGVERIWEAIVEHGHGDREYAYEYLTENIDYLFDTPKRRALELFSEKGRKFKPHVG